MVTVSVAPWHWVGTIEDWWDLLSETIEWDGPEDKLAAMVNTARGDRSKPWRTR